MQRCAARLEDGCGAIRRSAARLRSYGTTLVESAGCGSFLVSTSCFVFCFLYMWKFAPTLYLVCNRGPIVRGADWMLFVAQLLCTLALFVCCFDKPLRITKHMKTMLLWVLPSALFASTVKAVALAILHPGRCTFFEFLWCLSFSMVVTAMQFEEPRKAAVKGPTAAQAEAAVAAVIGKLGAEPPEVDAECGECAAPCPICLCEWEPEGGIRTTPCGHTYHEGCLKDWLMRQTLSRRAQSCAVCRRDLKPDSPEKAEGEAPAL